MDIEEIYNIYKLHPSVQTDSRKLKKGDLFFALKGPNFNGNNFAKKALDDGAAYVVVDEKLPFFDNRVIETGDVLQTLQELAKYHRMELAAHAKAKIPFIAITGSNGKTTTKELINKVLSSKYQTYTTEGNLNNHIGVPLTILKIRNDVEIVVIEMGANHRGEIAGYCAYAIPTHGLITNCGKAHLEGFGSVENIKKGKGELFDFIRERKGTAFVNIDDLAVLELAAGITHSIFYGKNGRDLRGAISQSDPFLDVEIKGTRAVKIETHLVGSYNFSNVLAAVCIGLHFHIEEEKIKEAIEAYLPTNSRSQMLKASSNSIISDTYNANPGSMQAAIENFATMKGDNKILILGSMMELGNESQNEHALIVSLIDKYEWKDVVLVGEGFNAIPHNYTSLENASEAREWFQKKRPQNAQILLKGSRSMQMEKVLE